MTFKTREEKNKNYNSKKSNKNGVAGVVEMAHKIENQAWVDKPTSKQDFGPLYRRF